MNTQPDLQPEQPEDLFSGFILNKATRAKTIEMAKEKTAEFRQMLFEELGEVDKCRYRTPEEVSTSQVRATRPDLEQLINGIQALEWYQRYLEACPDEVDIIEPSCN